MHTRTRRFVGIYSINPTHTDAQTNPIAQHMYTRACAHMQQIQRQEALTHVRARKSRTNTLTHSRTNGQTSAHASTTASTNTRTCGHLEGCKYCAANFCRPIKSIRGSPGSGTTTHPTTSWRTSCGAEKASTLCTLGCPTRTSSTSKGEMISPPLLITSLLRPVRYSQPSADRKGKRNSV